MQIYPTITQVQTLLINYFAISLYVYVTHIVKVLQKLKSLACYEILINDSNSARNFFSDLFGLTCIYIFNHVAYHFFTVKSFIQQVSVIYFIKMTKRFSKLTQLNQRKDILKALRCSDIKKGTLGLFLYYIYIH